jgi:hypothetical protein
MKCFSGIQRGLQHDGWTRLISLGREFGVFSIRDNKPKMTDNAILLLKHFTQRSCRLTNGLRTVIYSLCWFLLWNICLFRFSVGCRLTFPPPTDTEEGEMHSEKYKQMTIAQMTICSKYYCGKKGFKATTVVLVEAFCEDNTCLTC